MKTEIQVWYDAGLRSADLWLELPEARSEEARRELLQTYWERANRAERGSEAEFFSWGFFDGLRRAE